VSVVANVAINVDSRNAVSKLRQVQSQAQSTERAFGALQSAIGALGVGFALTKVIADVKELDTNLRRLGTVGGDVAALNKGLGSLSDSLDGVANKAELAAASYQALSAGFTETGANLRVVEVATKAAVGGLADVTSVVEVTTKTLNAYNMSGDQAAKVTDSISKAIEFGQVQWSDYTSQLGRVASVAAIAGVSLDEVNAFIAAATKNGATAEVAFTGLGSTLATILKPSKESADAAEQLGINWTLAGIKGEGFESLMGKLAKAMQENPELATQMVGGQEAVRGAFAAASKGGQDYSMILDGLGDATGKTDADFQIMKGSIENALKSLDTSFKNLSEALGTAFGPVVIKTISDVAGAINVVADALNAIPQPVKTATAEIVKLVAQMLLLEKAFKAIIALRLAFIGAMVGMTGATAGAGAAASTSAGAFALYTNNTKALQTQAATATPVVRGLTSALQNLAAIGIITVGINLVVSGLQEFRAAEAEIRRLRGERKAGGAAAIFGGSAPASAKEQAQKDLQSIKAEQKGLQSFAGGVVRTILGPLAPLVGQLSPAGASDRMRVLQEREKRAKAIVGLPTRTEQATPDPTPTPITTTGGGDDTGSKERKGKSDAEREAEKAARDAQRAAEQIKERLLGLTREIELNNQITTLKELQFGAEMDGNKELQARLQGEERIVQIMQSTAQSLDGITDERLQQKILAKAEGEIVSARQETILEMHRIETERTKNFDSIIADLDLELDLKTATTEQAREQLRLEAEIAKIRGDKSFTPQQQDEIVQRKTELAKPKTDAQNIAERIGTLKDEIKDLTSISNIAIKSAEGIGNAFAQSFKGLVSGTMTAKEALGSFFKSVADMFLEMAVEIIAKQVQMIILQTILNAIGGGAGGGGPATGAAASAKAAGAGAIPRAKGGPVASGSLYMVGEEGPELFVPFQSGTIVPADVTDDLVSPTQAAAAQVPFQGSPTQAAAAQVPFQGSTTQAAAAQVPFQGRGSGLAIPFQAAGAADRNPASVATNELIRFESTVINGMEFVTRSEAENIGRVAASRGAELAQKRLKNNPSARRAAGIS
jgi:TP901 family phage tail tape measure protein